MSLKSVISFFPALFVAIGLLLGGCATNPVSGGQDFVTMTEKQDLELGRQYHKEIMKQYTLYDAPELQAYVEEIGERLAQKSHRDNLVFHFYLLDSPQVNAFALPGGYIYITRGIMAYMQEEEHLAGVIGHEIGHVTARHGVRQQAQSQFMGLLGAAVAIGTGSRELAQLSNAFGSALVSGYGRQHELESDRLGAEYLAKSGYDPQKMIDVVGILKDQELFDKERAKAENRQPRTYHGVFASHPRNDTRLQEVVRAADRFKTAQVSRKDNGRFLQLTDGMVYGPSESQGVVRGNAFLHKDLDLYLKFPKGWVIDNLPDRVLARSSDGNQAIMLKMRDLNERVSAEQFLRSNFNPFSEGRSIDTSEDEAYTGKAIVDTKQGKQKIQVAAIYRGKKAFMMYALGKQQLPEQQFLQSVSSLRRLNTAELKQAIPKRIKVIKAKSGDTFRKLTRKYGSGNYYEQELRLINGMYPDGEPTKGQKIKVLK